MYSWIAADSTSDIFLVSLPRGRAGTDSNQAIDGPFYPARREQLGGFVELCASIALQVRKFVRQIPSPLRHLTPQLATLYPPSPLPFTS